MHLIISSLIIVLLMPSLWTSPLYPPVQRSVQRINALIAHQPVSQSSVDRILNQLHVEWHYTLRLQDKDKNSVIPFTRNKMTADDRSALHLARLNIIDHRQSLRALKSTLPHITPDEFIHRMRTRVLSGLAAIASTIGVSIYALTRSDRKT